MRNSILFSVISGMFLIGGIAGSVRVGSCEETPAAGVSSDPVSSTSTIKEESAPSGDSGEIQDRAVPKKFPPSITAVPPPAGIAPPAGFMGATDNITKVGRAIQVRTKSLSTEVVVSAGLALTQPVTISVLLGGAVPKRFTEVYVPSTGNRFVYDDPEVDGNPRNGFADITLTEPKPGGGMYTSTMPGSVLLDPLYDVSIGPLSFTLFTDCDLIGKSADVTVYFITPDHGQQEVRSILYTGRHFTIGQFAWSRAGVSASAKLRVPEVSFLEHDPKGPLDYTHGSLSTPPVSLVPGVTRQVVTTLKEAKGDCTASAQYNISYKLVDLRSPRFGGGSGR